MENNSEQGKWKLDMSSRGSSLWLLMIPGIASAYKNKEGGASLITEGPASLYSECAIERAEGVRT